MTVENSMKPCDGAMKQCDMGQNIPMPNGRNAISNMGQQAMGNFTTQITWEHVKQKHMALNLWLCCVKICLSKRKPHNSYADKCVDDLKVYQNNLQLETHSKSITRIIGYMGL